ncbi:MAG: hypothetical protein AAF490_32160, partial [Chloroflexota bacterium]
GYGFNVAEWDTDRLQAMGFNWMKVFDTPSTQQPVNVLLRLDANASHLSDVTSFANNIESIAINNGAYIDAYEIGNEVNLDATYGWGYGSTNVPPDADDYVTLLCAVYSKIKAADPTAIVVSAGLAPTGRVAGNWNGHPGHNGLFQDEREYLIEFVAAGGGNCTDAIGYHPYGYSADFDAAPDVSSGDATQNCANGFCFRGVEKFYEVMQANGLSDRKVWVTECGWITEPPASCLDDPGWSGRAWQIVSEQQQADNLVGSFDYATSNYPWMEAMFIFNLNFNTAPWITDQCEQMRFYGVQGRPAETALSEMPKVVSVPVGELTVSPVQWTDVITTGQQPYTSSMAIQLTNSGDANLSYTIGIDIGTDLTLTLQSPATGLLTPSETNTVTVNIDSAVQTAGQYSGGVTITAVSNSISTTQSVNYRLFVFDQLFTTYLPLMSKE